VPPREARPQPGIFGPGSCRDDIRADERDERRGDDLRPGTALRTCSASVVVDLQLERFNEGPKPCSRY
jgi:hypothetical protein